MRTNIPFQAPGINAPPRGPAQEQGSSPKRVLKDAGRQIRRNARDPDAAPFGVGKGPLVREGRKMQQPGNLHNVTRAGAEVFKQQSPKTGPVKVPGGGGQRRMHAAAMQRQPQGRQAGRQQGAASLQASPGYCRLTLGLHACAAAARTRAMHACQALEANPEKQADKGGYFILWDRAGARWCCRLMGALQLSSVR